MFCKSSFHLTAILSCILVLTACASKTSDGTDAEDNDGNTADIINNLPNYICDKKNKNFELQNGIDNPIINDMTIGPGCYYANKSVFIGGGAQLTILPDTILQFKTLTGLIVENGNIFAIGTATNPIYFTSDEVVKNQDNAWIGIDIRERSSKFLSNRFKFIIIEHAGSPQSLSALENSGDTASVKINDLTKYNGPVDKKPRILFSHNIVRDGVGDYGLLAFKSTYFETIEDNIFYGNANHPISIDVNESFRVNNSNKFEFNGQNNSDNKILITGKEFNVEKFPETQPSNQNLGENLIRDITWEKLDIPYEIDDVISVSLTNLTIEAGINLRFNPGSGLSITNDSTLTAIGSSSQPINMTSTSIAENTNWRGISFLSSDGNNVLRYTNIINAGADINSIFQISMSGVVVALNSNVEISNSNIVNSEGYGLYVDETSMLTNFNNNRLTGNAIGIAEISSVALSYLNANNIYGKELGDSIEDTILVIPDQFSSNNSYNFYNLGIPYVFESNLSIEGDLKIEAGTILLFKDSTSLIVRESGSLSAVGFENQRIRFSNFSQYMQSTGAEKYWHGIHFFFSNDKINNIFSYVDIEYAGEPKNEDIGALQLSNGALLTINNSNINKLSPLSGAVVQIDETSIIISDGTNNF